MGTSSAKRWMCNACGAGGEVMLEYNSELLLYGFGFGVLLGYVIGAW